MARLLLLLMIGGIAAHDDVYERTVLEPSETAYRAGSSYVYRYETQVVNGLPLTAPIYSIVKVKGTVNLDFKTATKVIMKMDDVNMFKMNGQLEYVDPTNELVPDEVLEPITGEEVTEIQRALSLPVKFRYTNGFVSGIVMEDEDPEWSVNFKKGCLGLLQVNLEKSKLIESSEAVVTETYEGETVNEAYTVMETTPAGECACTYIVEETSPGEEAESMFTVSKVRNFEDCLERPTFLYDSLKPELCEECDTFTSKPLSISSEVNYVLSGSREQFFIESVVGESSYILTTREKANGYAATFVNQTLEFVSSEAISAPIMEPRVPSECPEGIRAIVREVESREKMMVAERFVHMIPPEMREIEEEEDREEEESGELIEEAISALRAVAIDLKEGITEEGPAFSMVAVDILRTATLEELVTIWTKYNAPGEAVEEEGDEEEERVAYREPLRRKFIRERIEEEEEADEEEENGEEEAWYEEGEESIEEEIKRTLWFLMPYVGTVPSVKVICEAIKKEEIPEHILAYSVFPMLSISAEPVPETLELLLEIVKDDKAVTTKHARRTAWLGIGTLLNRMDEKYTDKYEELTERLEKTQRILTEEERGKPRRQLEEIAQRTRMMKEAIASTVEAVTNQGIEALTELLESSEVEEKIVALKAIGNGGIEEMLPKVVEIITEESLPVVVRQQAVYSMRRMAEEVPKEVMETLLPVFLDDDEDELVRIAAFTTILKCEPPVPYLFMIARSLEDEENPLVESYVYSYLSELSNSTYPCLKSLAVNASLAMKFIDEIPEGDSYVYHSSQDSDEYDTAQLTELSVIGSRDSVLPRGASIRYSLNTLGYDFDIVEAGIEARGIQAVIDKIIGPNGMLTRGKSVFDVLRPKRSIVSSRELVDEISRKIKLVERELTETELDMYIKYFGDELIYFSLNPETIDELISRERILTSISEESLREGYEVDIKIPHPMGGIKTVLLTEAGLPLTVHAHVASMAVVTGSWKAAIEPSLFETFRRGTKPVNAKIEMNIKPSFAADIIGTMGVTTAFYKSAVHLTNRAFIRNIEIAGTVEADFTKGKWFSSFEMPREEKRFAGLKSTPSTFIMNTFKPTIKEAMEVVVPEGGTMVPVYLKTCPEFNIGAKFALLSMQGQDVSSPGEIVFPMSGKKEFVLIAEPVESPAEKLNIEIQMVSSDESEDEEDEMEDDDEDEEEEGKSMMSSLLDTFWWGEDSEDADDWDENFDLRENDVSIVAMASEIGVPVMEEGEKRAIALTIEGEGTETTREIKMQCLVQRSSCGKRAMVNTKITTNMRGFKDTAHLGMTVNYHRNETTVGQLLNPEYQHIVMEHIKAASVIDTLSEVAVSRTNALWIKDWQRIITEIRESGVPKLAEAEDLVSPEFNPVERELYERVQRIIVKQELIARRVADPVLHMIKVENEERIASRLHVILKEAREIRREAEEALVALRDRLSRRVRSRKILVIGLKVNQAIRRHRDLLERIEVILKGSPLRESRRAGIERILREEIEGVERLAEIHSGIVEGLNGAEGERFAPNIEIDPEIEPTITGINPVTKQQIEIAKEIQKIREALEEGAELPTIIPRVKQILEHCAEILERIDGFSEELCGLEEERGTTIIPHLRLFKIILHQDLLLYHIKEIAKMVKYSTEAPLEEVFEIRERCEGHTVKLDILLTKLINAYGNVVVKTAERTAMSDELPELPVYLTAYINFTLRSERGMPWGVHMKISGDKSLEQLIYENRQASPSTRDPVVSRILEDEESVPESETREIREKINTLRKMKWEMEFAPEDSWARGVRCPPLRKLPYWAETYITAKNLWKLSYGVVNVTTPPGKVNLDFLFSLDGEQVSFAVMTPSKTTKIWGAPRPKIIPAGISILESERGIFDRVRSSVISDSAECSYKSQHVETFDGKIYHIPEARRCEKVLAMDCSPEKTFAIMLREEPRKVIRMVVEKQIVEIIPEEEMPILKINGAIRRFEEEEPIIIRGEGEYESTPIVLRMEKRNDEVIIRAARKGIVLRLLPEAIKIEASPFFRSKICGMCGNYDGQIREEFEDPELRVHARPESFGVRYLIPHETCEREELETKYPAEIISRPEGCIPVRRNVVRERESESGKVACISTIPVRRCPVGCEPEGEIRKTVGFHCLPGEDPSVRELIEESETRVLRKLISREKDKWESVVEPEECIRV